MTNELEEGADEGRPQLSPAEARAEDRALPSLRERVRQAFARLPFANAVGRRACLLHASIGVRRALVRAATIAGALCNGGLSDFHGAGNLGKKYELDTFVRTVSLVLLSLMTALFAAHFSIAMS